MSKKAAAKMALTNFLADETSSSREPNGLIRGAKHVIAIMSKAYCPA